MKHTFDHSILGRYCACCGTFRQQDTQEYKAGRWHNDLWYCASCPTTIQNELIAWRQQAKRYRKFLMDHWGEYHPKDALPLP